MLGEVNREEQVGIKYRYDQGTGREIILIPSKWLETTVVSIDFARESIKNFDEEACRGKKTLVIELNYTKILMNKKDWG